MAEVVKSIIDVDINTGNAAAELKILQQQINSVFLSLNKSNTTSAAAAKAFSSDLVEAINSSRVFTAEQVKMRTAAGALDDTLRKGQSTLSQYFSAKYQRNGALFAQTLDLARKRSALLQTQFIATGAASRGMQDAIAIKPLQAFSSEMAINAQRAQILSAMYKQGTTQLINFGKNVQWAGRQLMVGFTVPLTIFGTIAGKTFMDLEKQVVSFKKVYGDLFTTPQELSENLEAVKELANEYTKYGIAVKDTVRLAAEAAAAGRQNAELTDAVTQATRLGTLGQMEQAQALETTIALQSAFKLSGQDLADTINFLNMVENQTVVSLQDLSAAIPRVAPVIRGLGGDVKDMAVFLAAMQEGGVSAEQGANALKSGLASLINPTERAKDMLGELNINLDAIITKNRGDLMGTVMDFGKALQTLDEFSRQQALEQVFGKFQYARLGALFENITRDGSQASQVIDAMAYTTEELAATAEKELKTIEESFGVQLVGAIERFKLAIAPIGEIFVKLAIPLVNFATKVAEAFNSLPDFQKKFLAFATIITGLVVPAGTMFFGLLMNLTGTLARFAQFMGAFGKGFVQGGIVGAFRNAAQSAKYFSNTEIEAALAAQQLGTATEFTNSALRRQITEAMGAAGAVKYLSDSYTILLNKMMTAANIAPFTLGVGQTAAGLAATGRSTTGRIIRPPQMRNSGGPIFMSDGSTVPGTGYNDTVPAMLTPGEFVVNKDATQQNLDLLYAINSGGQRLNDGGKVKNGILYAMSGVRVGSSLAMSRGEAATAWGGGKSILQMLSSNVTIKEQQALAKALGLPSLTQASRIYSGKTQQRILQEANRYSGPLGLNAEKILSTAVQQGYVGKSGRVTLDSLRSFAKANGIYSSKGAVHGAHISSEIPTQLGAIDLRKMAELFDATAPRTAEVLRMAARIIEMDPTARSGVHLYNALKVKLLRENNYALNGAGIPGKTFLDDLLSRPDRYNDITKGLKIPKESSPKFVESLDDGFRGILTGKSNVTDNFIYQYGPDLVLKAVKDAGLIGKGLSNRSFGPSEMGLNFSKTQIDNLVKNAGYKIIKTTDSGRGLTLMSPDGKIFTYHTKGRRISLSEERAASIDKNLYNLPKLKMGGKVKGYKMGGKVPKYNVGGKIPNGMHMMPDGTMMKNSDMQYNMGGKVSGFQSLNLGGVARGFQSSSARRNSKYPPGFFSPYKASAKTLVPRAVREHMASKYPQMSPQVKEFFEKYITAKRSSPVTQYTKSTQFIADIDNTMRDIARYGERSTLQRLNERMKFNKGGQVPGVQYLFGGGIAARAKAMYDSLLGMRQLKKSVHGGPSGITSFHGLDKRQVQGPGTYLTKDKFVASMYAHRSISNRGAGESASLYSFTSKGLPNVLNLNRRISKSQKEDLISIIKGSNADDAYKNAIIQAISKSKTLDEARFIARSLPFKSNNADDFDFAYKQLRDKVNTTVGINDLKKDLVIGLESSKTINKSRIRKFVKEIKTMQNSGKYPYSDPSGINSPDNLNQLVIKNMDKFNIKETPINFQQIPGANKKLQNIFNLDSGGIHTQLRHSAQDPQLLRSLMASIFKPSQFDSKQRSHLTDLIFGSSGRINLRDSQNPVVRALYDKISGVKRQKVNNFTESGIPLGLNKGNIVPGVGNTDTVPAMLTPGEFVVNKEATQNNLQLLKSINNGSLMGYNKGGKISGVQYFATENPNRIVMPMNRSMFNIPPGPSVPYPQQGTTQTQQDPKKGMLAKMTGGMGTMGLMSMGFMLPMIGQQMQQSTSEFQQGIGQFMQALTPAAMLLALFPSKFGVVIAAVAALGVGMYQVIKKMKEIQQSGSKFVEAMYGSAESTKSFAETFGRQSNAQKLAQQQAGLIPSEATEVASQYMQTDAGKKLIEDVRTAQRLGGEAVDALRNQLVRQVLSGIITPEEARAIAAEVGVALGDAKIGVDVSAQIVRIVGINGENVSRDPIKVMAAITPEIDQQAIQKQASFMYEQQTKGFWGGLSKVFDIRNSQEYKIQQGLIAEAAIQAAAIEKEARASVTLALQQNIITAQQYIDTINKISQQSPVGIMVSDFFAREDIIAAEDALIKAKKAREDLLQTGVTNYRDYEVVEFNLTQAQGRYDKLAGKFTETVNTGVGEAFKNQGIEAYQEDFNAAIDKLSGGSQGIATKLKSQILTGDMSLNVAAQIAGLDEDQLDNLEKNATKAGKTVDEYFKEVGKLSDSGLQATVIDLQTTENGKEVDINKLQTNLAEILSLPPEVKTALDIDTSDIDDVLNYGELAPQIKKSFNDAFAYIQKTKEDVSKKDVQQKIIAKFVPEGTNLDFLFNYLTEGGTKELNPLKLPLLISIMADPAIRALIEQAMGPGGAPGSMQQYDKDSAIRLLSKRGITPEFFSSLTVDNNEGKEGGSKELSPIQQMRKDLEMAKKYQAALKKLNQDKVLSPVQISSMSEELAIQIAGIKNTKARKKAEEEFQNLLKRRNQIAFSVLTKEEQSLQVNDIQNKIYSRQIQLIDRRIDKKQDEIEVEDELNEVRSRGLDKLAEEEDKINEAYDKRLDALDKVDRANQRNVQRQRSRIDLAAAFASGDIAGAAGIAADINAQEASYKLEDTRSALEEQRERQLKGLKVEINGVLMTRKEIEDAIKASNEKIYQITQDIKKIEQEKIPILKLQEQLADARYQLELKSLAATTQNLEVYKLIAKELSGIGTSTPEFGGGGSPQTPGGGTGSETPMAQQDKYVKRAEQITKAINGQLKGSTKSAALSDFNRFINNSANKVLSKGERDLLISRYKLKINPPLYAMGGMVNYKGSKEAPPALKMAYGSLVPGMGNTDRVPALLTPGEFVVRKSVASVYMPLLESLNNQLYPGLMPKNAASNNSSMYNTYSVNVNVAGSNASPDEIANAVMSKIKAIESRSLRSVRIV